MRYSQPISGSGTSIDEYPTRASGDESRVSGTLHEIGCEGGAFVGRYRIGGDLPGLSEIFRREDELQLRIQRFPSDVREALS